MALRATCRRRSMRRARICRRICRQSDLSQGESGRCADHDFGADFGQIWSGQAVRRGVDDHSAEAVADSGRGAGECRRRRAAVGAGGSESDEAVQPMGSRWPIVQSVLSIAELESGQRADHERRHLPRTSSPTIRFRRRRSTSRSSSGTTMARRCGCPMWRTWSIRRRTCARRDI